MARRRGDSDDGPSTIDRDRSVLFGGGGSSSAGGGGGGRSRGSQTVPIFALDREDFWKVPGVRLGSVRLLAAAGGTTVLVTGDGTILRWGLDRGDTPDVIELRPPGASSSAAGASRADIGRVHGVWVDPTGSHVLISTLTAGAGCLFHLDRARTSAREVVGVRGQLIECVAWNLSRPGDDTRVGPALLATSTGRILSLRITDRKDSVGRLWELPDGESLPIRSLRLEVLSSSAASSGETGRFFVMAVTARPLRYYTFTGGPTIEAMFASASSRPITFNEIRGGQDVGNPSLAFALGGALCSGVAGRAAAAAIASGGLTGSSVARFKGDKPDCFAMLTGVGLFLARLTPSGGSGSSKDTSGGLTIVDPVMVGYPCNTASGGEGQQQGADADGGGASAGGPSSPSLPLGFAVTDYHILLLFRSRLLALSRVTLGVVWEAALPEDRYGQMRGITVDATVASGGYGGGPGASGASGNTDGSAVWLWSDRHVFQLGVTREERDVWRLFLSRGDFDSAALFTRNDPGRRELIAEAQADTLFAAGRTQEAAAAYARTRRPFEELCLKFINAGARPALKAYLTLRLKGLRPEDRLQRTLLATWLCEQYLDELTALASPAALQGGPAEAAYSALLSEFREFLRDEAPPPVTASAASAAAAAASGNVGGLDAATTISLLSGHGRTGELLFFCGLIKDYNRVVAHHVGQGAFADAVRAITAISRAEWDVGRPSASQLAASRRARKRGSGKAGAGGGKEDTSGGSSASEDGPVAELWYRYGPLLLTAEPDLTLAAWREAGDLLSPMRLVPAMVRYEQARAACAAAGGGSHAPTGGPGSSVLFGGDPGSLDAALVYCEWVVRGSRRGCTSRCVHNLLLSLYAAQPSEELLLEYVRDQTRDMEAVVLQAALPAGSGSGSGGGAAGTLALFGGGGGEGGDGMGGGMFSIPGLDDEEDDVAVSAAAAAEAGEDGEGGDGSGGPPLTRKPVFDLPYALRVCLAGGKTRTCVRLYTSLGLYSEALELALTVDLELAKDTANAAPREARGLRKKLWGRIAAWAVTHSSSGSPARDALGVLHASDGLLRVEDVLSFFPASTLIDEFKEEVTESLRSCDGTIAELKREMRDFHAAAERIRGDIRSLRNRCGYVRAGQRCELCAAPVLASQFYLFSCAHAFHRGCLLGEMRRHLNKAQRGRVEGILGDLGRLAAALVALGDTFAAADAAAAGAPAPGGSKAKGRGKAGGAAAAGEAALEAPALAKILALGSTDAATALLAGPSDQLRSSLASRRDELQGELDRYIAAECVFCGDVMIDSIADPFGAAGGMGAPWEGAGAVGGAPRGRRGSQTEPEDDDWDI